jgi:hypothetical protein
MTRSEARAAVLAVSVGLSSGACSAFSDPAVRLMRCIHEAAREVDAKGGEITRECDPRSPEAFTLVVHPARELADAELVAAGLPRELIDDVHALRIGGGDGVYVLPHDPRGRASRTSIGWRQAVVPEPLVVDKPARGRVFVVLREGAYGVALVQIR